jgi:ferredoxin
MLESMVEELHAAGVGKDRIRTESFTRELLDDAEGDEATGNKSEGPTVRFSLSGIDRLWEEKYESLLDFAEQLGIEISAGCRYGDCGTCLTELLDGVVVYNHRTGVRPDEGYCLPCSCRPSTSITLNA